MRKALAIDVGGTKSYNAVVDETGNIISEVEKHSTPKNYEYIIKTFKSDIEKFEVFIIVFLINL